MSNFSADVKACGSDKRSQTVRKNAVRDAHGERGEGLSARGAFVSPLRVFILSEFHVWKPNKLRCASKKGGKKMSDAPSVPFKGAEEAERTCRKHTDTKKRRRHISIGSCSRLMDKTNKQKTVSNDDFLFVFWRKRRQEKISAWNCTWEVCWVFFF